MDSSIIIMNLPAGVYVPELCNEFRCFGNILSATVQANEGRKSDWEACIAFEENFSALQAVKRMNEHRMRNKSLKVLMSSEHERFRKVFVKNFSPSWDECDLLKAFEDIGSAEDAKISEEKGKSNCYGYLIFKSHFTAKRAVESMNGKVVNGLKLQVERFKSKAERDSLMQNSVEHVEELLKKSVQLNNLHVKNLPADFTEDEFRKLFQRHGEITSLKIMTDGKGASKGFGFVSFTKNEDAAKALKRLNNYTLRGKMLQVSFKEDGQLRKKYVSLKNKSREVQIKQYKQRSQSVPKLLPHPLNYRQI